MPGGPVKVSLRSPPRVASMGTSNSTGLIGDSFFIGGWISYFSLATSLMRVLILTTSPA